MACIQAGCGVSSVMGTFLEPGEKGDAVRFVSWNIKAGQGSSLSAVIHRLSGLNADVVALQEVDRDVPRSGDVDEAAIIAAKLGMNHVFAPAIPLDGGEYGIAILSRFPINEVVQIPLTNASAAEKRTALQVTICSPQRCFVVLNHHADYVKAAAEVSIREVLAAVVDRIGQGIVFEGDMNQTPSEPGPVACSSAGLCDLVARFAEARSFGSERIDYIWVDGSLSVCARSAGVVAAPESDHNAILADLNIREGMPRDAATSD